MTQYLNQAVVSDRCGVEIRHHMPAARDRLTHAIRKRRQRLAGCLRLVCNLKSYEFQLQGRADQVLDNGVVNLMRNPLTFCDPLLKAQTQAFGSAAGESPGNFSNNSSRKTNCQYQEPLRLPKKGFELH